MAFVPSDTANYNTPENVAASVAVNPAAPKITITAANKSAVVGSAQPELTYTVSGLADGEELATAPTLTCTPDMATAVSYPITASGAVVPNTSNYNENITYVEGTLAKTSTYCLRLLSFSMVKHLALQIIYVRKRHICRRKKTRASAWL